MFDRIVNAIKSIDWQQFHFLRPHALYFFIPLVIISVLLTLSNRDKNKWKGIVAAHLRPFLFTKSSYFAMFFPLTLFFVTTSCCILGLAGPTWKKNESPTEKIQAVVLIVLDLSKSMLSKDIQPTRLERAKFKISDFLDANPKARTGLTVFAGTTHPVLPFTSDYKLIKLQASSLENREMPFQGSNYQLLMQYVDTTMKKIVAPSTVVLMTDAISESDISYIKNWINGSIHHMEIILFSTPNGAEVPGYKNVRTKQDPNILRLLLQESRITITPLTLDKSDVQGIAKRVSEHLSFQKEKEKNDKDWADMGWLMLFPALLLSLFQFRKGWSIQWCWLFLISFFVSCGVKSKHPDWWYSRDFQGQLLSDNSQFTDAAETFSDDQRKAIAFYKAGNFEAAVNLFELDSSEIGTYNLGLALGKLGRWDEALDAIRRSGRLDPVTENKIKRNITRDSLKNVEANAISSDKKDHSHSNSKKEKKNERQKRNEDNDKQSEEEKNKVTDNRKASKSAPAEDVTSKKRTAKETDEPPKDNLQKKNQEAATDILLKRAAADPGEFLHRRFLLQKKRYYRNLKPSGDPW